MGRSEVVPVELPTSTRRPVNEPVSLLRRRRFGFRDPHVKVNIELLNANWAQLKQHLNFLLLWLSPASTLSFGSRIFRVSRLGALTVCRWLELPLQSSTSQAAHYSGHFFWSHIRQSSLWKRGERGRTSFFFFYFKLPNTLMWPAHSLSICVSRLNVQIVRPHGIKKCVTVFSSANNPTSIISVFALIMPTAMTIHIWF